MYVQFIMQYNNPKIMNVMKTTKFTLNRAAVVLAWKNTFVKCCGGQIQMSVIENIAGIASNVTLEQQIQTAHPREFPYGFVLC